LYIYLLCFPLDTFVPVGRVFLEVRLREVSVLTNTHPAIFKVIVVSCNIRSRAEFYIFKV